MNTAKVEVPNHSALVERYLEVKNEYNRVMGAINTSYGSAPVFLSEWRESEMLETLEAGVEWTAQFTNWISEADSLRVELRELLASGADELYRQENTAIHEAIRNNWQVEQAEKDAERRAQALAERVAGVTVMFQTSWLAWTIDTLTDKGAILKRDYAGKTLYRRVSEATLLTLTVVRGA